MDSWGFTFLLPRGGTMHIEAPGGVILLAKEGIPTTKEPLRSLIKPQNLYGIKSLSLLFHSELTALLESESSFTMRSSFMATVVETFGKPHDKTTNSQAA